ncbi:Protein of unknown function [Frankineae bacterium MT45]|nr:Protein of unknown function [Frankineae bacterium MT45]
MSHVGKGIPPPSVGARPLRQPSLRIVAGRAVGVVAVALDSWWIVAGLDGMVTSPDDFFSDLEAQGRPHAAVFSHLDVAAGLLTILALVLRGSRARSGRRPEWLWLIGYAAAGAVGGLFPYVCAEGVDAACRTAEWHLRLPLHHYVHVIAGICEFAAASVAITLAWRRSVVGVDPVAKPIRALGWILLFSYPALGYAYLSDRLGAFVEPIFFIVFSAMVLIELFERGPTEVSSEE